MAVDPFWGALANAGATVAVGGGNLISDIIFNRQRKELQEKIFQREDTAVQRRAADLEAAGLSKTLAAGGQAQAGPVVSMNAPKWEGENPANAYLSGKMQQMDIANAQAQNQLILNQVRKSGADADYQEIQNQILRDTALGEIGKRNAIANVAIQTASDQIEQMSQETTRRALENADRNLELTIKNQQIDENGYRNAILNVQKMIVEQYSLSDAKAELVSKELANEITKYNKDWFQGLKLPVANSADIYTKVLGALNQLGSQFNLKTWLENLPKGRGATGKW